MDHSPLFSDLTPDKLLNAIEQTGLHCSGRIVALNSLENRVFEVELDLSAEEEAAITSPYQRARVAKFYRPGRWTSAQLLEEHRFTTQLAEAEVPVVAPLSFNGNTLHTMHESTLAFVIFPKVGGRISYEPSDDQLRWLGRMLARLHIVGAQEGSNSRLALTPETYGRAPLEALLRDNWIPLDLVARYQRVTSELLTAIEALFRGTKTQRIHGDCHLGNVLWGSSGPFWVDFDDMVVGPPVQDLWLLVPNRDAEGLRQREIFLEGYESMAAFDRSSLVLIEPLRTLRYINYAAWIARRWQDPAFQRAFPEFKSWGYWSTHIADLEEQLQLIRAR
jgi:Ser/Thr protein kinase RdoA (MazF antagonist)